MRTCTPSATYVSKWRDGLRIFPMASRIGTPSFPARPRSMTVLSAPLSSNTHSSRPFISALKKIRFLVMSADISFGRPSFRKSISTCCVASISPEEASGSSEELACTERLVQANTSIIMYFIIDLTSLFNSGPNLDACQNDEARTIDRLHESCLPCHLTVNTKGSGVFLTSNFKVLGLKRHFKGLTLVCPSRPEYQAGKLSALDKASGGRWLTFC